MRKIKEKRMQSYVLRARKMVQEGKNKEGAEMLSEGIPHFFVQKMHRLLSCLKYQGRVLQEEREDKKNEYDCFNG